MLECIEPTGYSFTLEKLVVGELWRQKGDRTSDSSVQARVPA